jgi:16S rRNA processing protein RimM
MEGARVETTDGRVVGSFAGIEGGGAQDLWVIAHEGRERLIPAVPEIVVEVSVAERRIVIDPPEGLLEL